MVFRSDLVDFSKIPSQTVGPLYFRIHLKKQRNAMDLCDGPLVGHLYSAYFARASNCFGVPPLLRIKGLYLVPRLRAFLIN